MSWSIVEICDGVCVVFFRSSSGVDLCVCRVVGFVLELRRLASLCIFVRRLSCMLSEWVRGVCIFSGSGVGLVCAIGQCCYASSWYVFIMLMIRSAALSILWDVIVWVLVSLAR